MSWTVATVVLALLVPALTRGSYARLLHTTWLWNGLLALGLGIQVVLGIVDLPESRWHDLGFGLLVASYVVLIGWCARNVSLRGMAVVLVGVSLNALAIAANQGMPVDVPRSWADDVTVEPTVKHHPRDADDRLIAITDIVPVPGPWPTMASFGDLILTVGLCDVAFHASRRGRRRRTVRRDESPGDVPPDDEPLPGVEPVAAPDAAPVDDAARDGYDPLAALSAYARGRATADDATERVEDARVVQVTRR